MSGEWTVHVVDRDLTDQGTLVSARPGKYSTKAGYEPGECAISVSLWDPVLISKLPIDGTLAREVAIYEGDDVRWRGKVGRCPVDFAGQTVTLNCQTLEGYDEDRFFGWAQRTNQASNASFEDWTAGMPDDWATDGAVTVTQVAAIAEGTYAAKLTGTGPDGYLWQQNPTGFDIKFVPGLPVELVAYGQIASGASFDTGDLLAELIVDGPPGTFTEFFEIDDTIQFDVMFRISVILLVAAGVDWTGEFRLHTVNGDITWDRVQVVYNDATTVEQPGEDLAVLVEHVSEYSQTSPWSDVEIVHDCPDTGLVVLRGFEHAKHELIADAYRQLIEEYGCDIWVGLDRIRHMRTKRGRTRDDLAVTITVIDVDDVAGLAEALTIAPSLDVDPSQARNVIIVTGEGATFATDEAGAVDLSALSGLTLAEVSKAPNSAKPLDLSKIAAQKLVVKKQPPTLVTLTFPIGDDPPEVGDVIPATISFGWAQVAVDLRVNTATGDPETRTVACAMDLDDGLPLTDEGS